MYAKNYGMGKSRFDLDKQWTVEFHEEFLPEFREFTAHVKRELAARLERLQEQGPLLGRPYVDTLKGAKYANMKELRFDADGGVWRIAFAFDPERSAILLVGGDKAGISKDRFYADLIDVADRRFAQHLTKLCIRQRKGNDKK
jgi:hypothetical protein